MAMRSEELSSSSVAGRQRPIQYVTENGFSIIRRSLGSDTAPKYHFLVRHPDGRKREVTVEFDDGVIALVENVRGGRLSFASGFWVNCAERCLATYLWENDDYPPSGQLSITEFSSDESLLATYWRD